jgi:hypothetical protein
MTEAEWLACADTRSMLRLVQDSASERRLRLFVLACCWEVWGASADEPTRLALECADRFAEAGSSVKKNLVRVRTGHAVIECGASEPLGQMSVWDGDDSLKRVDVSAVDPALRTVLEELACARKLIPMLDWLVEQLGRTGLSPFRQAELFRDIVPGPFSPPLFRSAWRTENGGAALRVAQTIYDEEAFDQLPILADALLDAGCDSDAILRHLHGCGPHVRDCWALDLILGTEPGPA